MNEDVKRSVDVPKFTEADVCGALFDFMGFLTTQNESRRIGASEEAGQFVPSVQKFIRDRGMSDERANVQFWSADKGLAPHWIPAGAGVRVPLEMPNTSSPGDPTTGERSDQANGRSREENTLMDLLRHYTDELDKVSNSNLNERTTLRLALHGFVENLGSLTNRFSSLLGANHEAIEILREHVKERQKLLFIAADQVKSLIEVRDQLECLQRSMQTRVGLPDDYNTQVWKMALSVTQTNLNRTISWLEEVNKGYNKFR